MTATERKRITKQQLIGWLSNNYNNCGYTDYFGFEMPIEQFEKKLMKKKYWELSEMVFSTNIEGQEFIESFQKIS